MRLGLCGASNSNFLNRWSAFTVEFPTPHTNSWFPLAEANNKKKQNKTGAQRKRAQTQQTDGSCLTAVVSEPIITQWVRAPVSPHRLLPACKKVQFVSRTSHELCSHPQTLSTVKKKKKKRPERERESSQSVLHSVLKWKMPMCSKFPSMLSNYSGIASRWFYLPSCWKKGETSVSRTRRSWLSRALVRSLGTWRRSTSIDTDKKKKKKRRANKERTA